MIQLFSFRNNNQNNLLMNRKNYISPQSHKIQTTKMKIQQKMHDMDQQIQKRLLLQLKLSKDQELFNTCKEKYLKKLIHQKENMNNVNVNMDSNRFYYDDDQQKSDNFGVRKEFKEYLERSDVIYDYLNTKNPLKNFNLQNQLTQKETFNNESNKLSNLDSYSQNINKRSRSKKSLNKKSQRKISNQNCLKGSRCLSQKQINDKSNKAIRSKGLSRIKSQILENQAKLIDSTSMMSYGFKTYELNAYDQQKRLKDQITLKICKSSTNLKRKTRKNF